MFLDTTWFGTTSVSSFLTYIFLHEFGHNYGYGDSYNCGYGSSVMWHEVAGGQPPSYYYTDLTYTDKCMLTILGTCDPDGTLAQSCAIDHNGYLDTETCNCVGQSPIMLSINDNKLELTAPEAGVLFDINGDGTKERLSWTRRDRNDGFLVLDRNGNGAVDNGKELFGNFSPDSGGPVAGNGFRALAFFDSTANGGNGDGVIDSSDSIFAQLRLWFDHNHDGVSQLAELHPLSEFGVQRFWLDYRRVGKKDRYGNQFTFRAEVSMNAPSHAWSWDVFLALVK